MEAEKVVLSIFLIVSSLAASLAADQTTPVFGLVPINGFSPAPSPGTAADATPTSAIQPTAAPAEETTECEFSLSKNQIDPHTDLQANAMRVTVFGSAKGKGFTSENFVQIYCNARYAGTVTDQSFPKAHNTAFSSTELSYTGYCTYTQDTEDVAYQVSARLMPQNIGCTPTTKDTIQVKGTTQNAEPTTEATPRPTGSEEPSLPAWNSDEPADQPPGTPAASETRRVALQFKWSLIGLPFTPLERADTTCVRKFYAYDAQKRKYVDVTGRLDDPQLEGKGIWAKRGSTAGDCEVSFQGQYQDLQKIELKKGWNLVSIQTQGSLDTKQDTGCRIVAGPYGYSGFVQNGKPQGYFKRERLDNGNGYWIKVADDCTLNNPTDEEPPATPGT